MRKLGVTVLGFVAIATALSIVSHFRIAALEAADSESVSAALARSEFTPAELREDIATLRTWLEVVHPAEIQSLPLERRAEQLLTNIETSIYAPLDHKGFYQRLAPIVHAINDEHTVLFPPDGVLESAARAFPLKVAILDGRVFIRSGAFGEAVAGDEIVSINDIPAQVAVSTLMYHYPGTGTRQQIAYLEDDFSAALSYMPPKAPRIDAPFAITVRNPDTGVESTVHHDGIVSTYAADAAFDFEVTRPGVLLFSYRAFDDEGDRFDEFLETLFDTAKTQNINSLIIDLRRNRGGASAFGDQVLDYLTDQPFTQLKRVDVTVSDLVREHFLSYVPGFARWLPVQYLHPFLKPLWSSQIGDVASIDFDLVVPSDNPLRFDGDVYVLIGPRTMSSATLFAATIRHYDIGTLIGEETGGFATMYGNVVDARLPNTGLKVWMPTSVVYGKSEGPVVPDHQVVQAIEDLAKSKDSVLDYTLALIAGN